jgi:hypothetical protein
MLELHNGRWELIDRELFRARVRELLELHIELYREALNRPGNAGGC